MVLESLRTESASMHLLVLSNLHIHVAQKQNSGRPSRLAAAGVKPLITKYSCFQLALAY